MKLLNSLALVFCFISTAFADEFASSINFPLKASITYKKVQVDGDEKRSSNSKEILHNYALTSLTCNPGKHIQFEIVGPEYIFKARISSGVIIFYQGTDQEINGKFLISKPYLKSTAIRLDKNTNVSHKLFVDHVFASTLIDRHILWVISFKEHKNEKQSIGSTKLYEHSFNVFLQAGSHNFLELHKSCHGLHNPMETISYNELVNIKKIHPLMQTN